MSLSLGKKHLFHMRSFCRLYRAIIKQKLFSEWGGKTCSHETQQQKMKEGQSTHASIKCQNLQNQALNYSLEVHRKR